MNKFDRLSQEEKDLLLTDMYEALKELLPCVGWSNFTDAELQREHELGNGAAIKIMKARAALAKVQP